MSSARPVILLMATLLVTVSSCDASPSSTTAPPPASAEEVELFCERYSEVRDRSRQEILVELLEVAPAEIVGPIKRASELGGSFEDDEAIDAFIDRCGGP